MEASTSSTEAVIGSKEASTLPCRESFHEIFRGSGSYIYESICGSFHGRYFHGSFCVSGSFRGSKFTSTEAFTKAFTEAFTNHFTEAFTEAFVKVNLPPRKLSRKLSWDKFASTEAFTKAFMESFTDASVGVNSKFAIIYNSFLLQQLQNKNPMKASAIASVKEKYCHESFCESFRHVVDILFILYIP